MKYNMIINHNEMKIMIPKIEDVRGNLSFLQFPDQIPFPIERLFWIHSVPAGEKRGGHAYKSQHECIVAISGSFDVVVSHLDGKTETIQMNQPFQAIHLPPLTWRNLENFSSNSLSLHLSSSVYNPSDYIRSWDSFIDQTL